MSTPKQILCLLEAQNLRAERLAEIDRRVLQALRGEMTVRQLHEDMSGRYSYELISSSLRRCERRGEVEAREPDATPRLRNRTFVKPRRVRLYRKVEQQTLERVG